MKMNKLDVLREINPLLLANKVLSFKVFISLQILFSYNFLQSPISLVSIEHFFSSNFMIVKFHLISLVDYVMAKGYDGWLKNVSRNFLYSYLKILYHHADFSEIFHRTKESFLCFSDEKYLKFL